MVGIFYNDIFVLFFFVIVVRVLVMGKVMFLDMLCYRVKLYVMLFVLFNLEGKIVNNIGLNNFFNFLLYSFFLYVYVK